MIHLLPVLLALAQLPPDARAALEAAAAAGRQAEAVLVADQPVRTRLSAGDDLQGALNAGGLVELTPGATFAGQFTVSSDTTLRGNGAAIHGPNGPALFVALGARNVVISDLIATSGWTGAVIEIGANTPAQNTIALAPSDITLERVIVPRHNGRRGIEVNGVRVSVIDCEVLETWSTAGHDSVGLGILNAPGPVTIRGGRYQAGSIGILTGGDTMKIPGIIPTDILIEGVEVSRPMSWRTDGVVRKVKNLIEFKTGRNVIIRRVLGFGSWRDGQSGYALLFTPGSGGFIENVVVEDAHFWNVANGVQVTGRNDNSVTPHPTRGIVIRRTRFDLDKDLGGSGLYGRFLHIQQEAEDVTAEDVIATGNVGTSQILGAYGTVMNPDGTTRTAGPMRRLELRRNRIACGSYGLNLGGGANGSLAGTFVTELLDVSGNTFGGCASAMRANFPSNTFIDRATFDAMP